jgi:hypothetical protein
MLAPRRRDPPIARKSGEVSPSPRKGFGPFGLADANNEPKNQRIAFPSQREQTAMPPKVPTLIALRRRLAEVRRIVTNQRTRIAKLKAAGRRTEAADEILLGYASWLRRLEQREEQLKQKPKTRKK